MNNRACILTTHSMEEADALCSRIGIMVNGAMQCIGTPQHLKAKFGEGYELEIRYTDNVQAKIHAFVTQHFPEALQIDVIPGRISYSIVGSEKLLGRVFALFEAHKDEVGIVDYSFNQPTLEGVFIKFARKQIDETV